MAKAADERSTSKTFVRKTLVSAHRWAALRERADPIKRDLMDLMRKHGHAEDYIRRVVEIKNEAWITESTYKKGGAPAKWVSKNFDGETVIGENTIYAWYAIEVEYRAARRRKPEEKLSLKQFLERLFKKRRLLVVQGNKIETAGHARRLHSAVEMLMRGNPVLRVLWERRADWGAERKLGLARKLPL